MLESRSNTEMEPFKTCEGRGESIFLMLQSCRQPLKSVKARDAKNSPGPIIVLTIADQDTYETLIDMLVLK